jgi:hypothetical protein
MTNKYTFTPRTPGMRRYRSPLAGRFFSEHVMPEWMLSPLSADEEDDFYMARSYRTDIFTKEIKQ